jgi:TonB family protein
LPKKTISEVCSGRVWAAARLVGALLIVLLSCSGFSYSAEKQDDAPVFPRDTQDQLNGLASRVADHIRNSKIDPAFPKIFVIDFTNAGDKQFSKLGSVLADDLAQSLSGFASGFQVEDRKSFNDYLKENWMGLDDLESEVVCVTLARSMGGAGVVRGNIETEANQQLRITLQVDGMGPAWSADIQLSLTPQLQELLKEPAISFARPPDAIPTEPGILQPGVDGVTLPVCAFCPSPDYTELARTAKYRGTVELSLIVTKDGVVNSVKVLKGAPFSLTQQAIDTVQKWKFKPAKLEGRSVPVRVPVDIEFHLY